MDFPANYEDTRRNFMQNDFMQNDMLGKFREPSALERLMYLDPNQYINFYIFFQKEIGSILIPGGDHISVRKRNNMLYLELSVSHKGELFEISIPYIIF